MPIDLNGYSSYSHMRTSYSSNTFIAFTTSVNGNEGSVTLSLNANTSSSMNFGRYVYDVELIDSVSNNVSRIIEGIVTITPEVTR